MQKTTFFFYDLETSGLNSRHQRVMQFAGQRTDMDLQPIGEPYNFFVKLPEDILPEIQAILITKTTPQMTLQDGYSEPEFARILSDEIFTPGTIAVGFNSVRFDDEFIRHTLWRNFYDPYEWSWSDGRGRWDILDVVRMTRALRPDGIVWPTDDKGRPTNKLELLSQANNLTHLKAHDALSDVEATISVARLIKEKQPKLFDFLLEMRHKKTVEKLVNLDSPQPFVYSSGKYGSSHDFTTVALPITSGSRPGAVLVYDLRVNPEAFSTMSIDDIKKNLFATRQERQSDSFQAIPVKELAYNKCPAVAPLGVLDEDSLQRLDLNLEIIKKHRALLDGEFIAKIKSIYSDRPAFKKDSDVEGQLYDSFINGQDKVRMSVVRAADGSTLKDFKPEFKDGRFDDLLLRYKARNFAKSLSDSEQESWQTYRQDKFNREAPGFAAALQKASQQTGDKDQDFLLEELHLWLESTAPTE